MRFKFFDKPLADSKGPVEVAELGIEASRQVPTLVAEIHRFHGPLLHKSVDEIKSLVIVHRRTVWIAGLAPQVAEINAA